MTTDIQKLDPDAAIDLAYDIFLEMAGENLDPADIMLFNLQFEVIHAQRAALLQARDEGIFSSAALEGALARLDNEEILLVSSSGTEH